jgi:hypothetical protein
MLEGPECKIGIENHDARRQLCLKIERTSQAIERKVFRLEFVKRITGMFSGLQKVRDWTVWGHQHPPERKSKDRTLWRG